MPKITCRRIGFRESSPPIICRSYCILITGLATTRREMASGGRNSVEYIALRNLSSDISSGIKDGFTTVVTKAFEVGLITQESKRSWTDARQDLHDRCCEFCTMILEKVELYRGVRLLHVYQYPARHACPSPAKKKDRRQIASTSNGQHF